MSTTTEFQVWKTDARRDDWHTRFVGSDIRQMLGEIERLEAELVSCRACRENLDCLSRGEAMKATPAQPDWNYTGPGLGGPSTKD